MTRLWILGASDPEMAAIESLLIEAGEKVAYATLGGKRARPDQAYRADNIELASGRVEDLPESSEGLDVYEVECTAFMPALTGANHTSIDHHRDGDPGYGRPPAEFLTASSIGQVLSLFASEAIARQDWTVVDRIAPQDCNCDGTTTTTTTPGQAVHCSSCGWVIIGLGVVPHNIVLTAAADHCLGAAYRGECPGVDPEELMRWRIASRAKFQGRSEAEILADVERARNVLRASRSHDLGIADLTREFVPELPEAAAREGIAFIACVAAPDGRRKVVCQAGTPAQIQWFLDHYPATDKYGDPARGFAGGYLLSHD